MSDLKPEDAIELTFDAPSKTGENKTKGAMEFLGSFNKTSGNMTSYGIYKKKGDPSKFKIAHLTQFTYYEALVDSDWMIERLYASPVMYTIAISHMYLLATLIIGLVCYKNEKKKHTDVTIFDSKFNDFTVSKNNLKSEKNHTLVGEDVMNTQQNMEGPSQVSFNPNHV